ncbi:MAG: hypothetical protein O2921_03125 [Chloroflexi bacterium]|jgi:hypothetical protein|nr:hypothetical protein [Chloroflexota bacterium]MDA1281606.1 hypothetical protein [Chloroflexota bacterium]
MPDWWLEATLPTVSGVVLFVLWVFIPAPEGESDFGSRLRDRFRK